MAIVLQNSEQKDITSGGSTTKNVTLSVHASSDFLVIKHISFQGALGDEGITGMTLNGVALTKAIDSATNSTAEWASIWYLAAPTTGTQTLAITYNVNGNPFGSSVVSEYWSGASATIGAVASAFNPTNTTTASTVTLSGVTAGGVTTDVIYSNTSTMTPGSGQTTVYEGAPAGAGQRAGASYEAGETAPSWTFALNPARTAHSAMEIKLAAAAGRTTKNTRTSPLGIEIGMGWRMDL